MKFKQRPNCVDLVRLGMLGYCRGYYMSQITRGPKAYLLFLNQEETSDSTICVI